MKKDPGYDNQDLPLKLENHHLPPSQPCIREQYFKKILIFFDSFKGLINK